MVLPNEIRLSIQLIRRPMTATAENLLTSSAIVPVQVLLEQYAISHPEIDSDEALEVQLDLIERAYHFSTLHLSLIHI